MYKKQLMIKREYIQENHVTKFLPIQSLYVGWVLNSVTPYLLVDTIKFVGCKMRYICECMDVNLNSTNKPQKNPLLVQLVWNKVC